jgi:hypothetical protein
MEKVPYYITLIEYNEYINDYPKELVDILMGRGICTVNKNKITFKVTGLLIYKNTCIIVFPKAYKFPKDRQVLKEHIQVLFNVLLRYKRDADCTAEEEELLGGENGQHNENLISAYRLIQDFTQNGLLLKQIRIKALTNTGNIDWTATINKRHPVFSGKSVVYIDTISRKTTVDRQNQLLLLHKYCVFKSLEKYGWLFGLSSDNAELDVTELNCDVSYAINFLTKELNSTFAEREINVIKMIRDFLSGIEMENNEEKLETFVTPYFQNVWELICGSIFSNQYNTLIQIIPKLNWEIDSSAVVQPQRPDIIFLQDQVLYILDAKYYDTDSNLPGWHDVVKQLFYAFTIFKNIKSKDFRLIDKKLEKRVQKVNQTKNIFLFPSGDEEPIKYIGKVNIKNNKDFNDIKAYKINTFLAMKCYVGKARYNFINHL